ncbi:MAG: SDR family NAD(P)-dependent oxidoreductase [Vicinamibacterales bacterium]
MTLQDRVVLLTGGRRIGAVVAEAVARRGADVALSYRSSREEADATAEVVRALGRRSAVVRADLADEADCAALVAQAGEALGRIDALVHLASVYESVPLDALDAATWDRHLSVDLRAAFLCARAVVPHLRAQGGGRIVLSADWVAASGRPRYRDYVAYYVAKSGVIALGQALALELAPDGILVNTVAPGPILAPPGTSAEEEAAVARATPLGRWGGPEEIAKAVVALIDSDFITGETIRVDGGRHLK